MKLCYGKRKKDGNEDIGKIYSKNQTEGDQLQLRWIFIFSVVTMYV